MKIGTNLYVISLKRSSTSCVKSLNNKLLLIVDTTALIKTQHEMRPILNFSSLIEFFNRLK